MTARNGGGGFASLYGDAPTLPPARECHSPSKPLARVDSVAGDSLARSDDRCVSFFLEGSQ